MNCKRVQNSKYNRNVMEKAIDVFGCMVILIEFKVTGNRGRGIFDAKLHDVNVYFL